MRSHLIVCLILFLLIPSFASARRDREVLYHYDQVWNASVRLIRVDYRFTISDRDDANGFLLFEYRDAQGHAYPASLELIRTSNEQDGAVRISMHVASMPGYVEIMMLDRLEQKLRQDFGQPLRRTSSPSRRETSPTEPNSNLDGGVPQGSNSASTEPPN